MDATDFCLWPMTMRTQELILLLLYLSNHLPQMEF